MKHNKKQDRKKPSQRLCEDCGNPTEFKVLRFTTPDGPKLLCQACLGKHLRPKIAAFVEGKIPVGSAVLLKCGCEPQEVVAVHHDRIDVRSIVQPSGIVGVPLDWVQQVVTPDERLQLARALLSFAKFLAEAADRLAP